MGNPNESRTLHTPLIQWAFELLSVLASDEIVIPIGFKDQVYGVRNLLKNDNSGLINTVLDFAIKAAIVDYTVQTDNDNLTRIFTEWLDTINRDLRGKIPTGINALAKQYFLERWKGSSLCVLRTAWEDVNGFTLPTKMWFAQGEDVFIRQPQDKVIIGSDEYYLILANDYESNAKSRLLLKNDVNQAVFIQKPFSKWTDLYPVPFIIQRGLYENCKFLDLISSKGQKIISRALEYLLLMKKGDADLAKLGKPEFIYSKEDLQEVKQDLQKNIIGNTTSKGVPVYTTNFDTEMTHLIPDYKLAVNSDLHSPIEKKILAGLGIIDIVDGATSSRRESVLNPKPFITELYSGIEDFKQLLTDIMGEIIDRNKNRKKYTAKTIKIFNTQPKEFITKEIRDHLRAAYDRGQLSHQTFIELVCDGNFMQETERRKKEAKDGVDDLLYPHIIQNLEQYSDAEKIIPAKPQKEDLSAEKTGPEAKNFKNASVSEDGEIEQSFYKTNDDLPESVKSLPAGAKSIWRKTFNSVIGDGESEETAFKIAWSSMKRVYKKVGDRWVKREKAEIEEELKDLETAELLEIKKLEILGKKNRLLDKLLSEEK